MDDEKALLFIREEIDSIDQELISLLESRLNLSLQIGKLKLVDFSPILVNMR